MVELGTLRIRGYGQAGGPATYPPHLNIDIRQFYLRFPYRWWRWWWRWRVAVAVAVAVVLVLVLVLVFPPAADPSLVSMD